jgi:hypothetical protein
MPLPKDLFLASKKHKFIYIVIPKAASTSIKTWMMHLEEKPIKYVHDDCRKHFQVSRIRLSKKQISEYYKFTFVRNPHERLASAYINKFVYFEQPRLNNAVDLVKKIRGRANIDKGITFEEFVRHIGLTNVNNADVHWRPQHLFINEIKPNFIGKVENIGEDFQTVQNKIGSTTRLPITNKSDHQKSDKYYGNTLPYMIKGFGAKPTWEEYYNKELYDKVTKIYQKDFETFGYQP